jgi:hypothetical protein
LLLSPQPRSLQLWRSIFGSSDQLRAPFASALMDANG